MNIAYMRLERMFYSRWTVVCTTDYYNRNPQENQILQRYSIHQTHQPLFGVHANYPHEIFHPSPVGLHILLHPLKDRHAVGKIVLLLPSHTLPCPNTECEALQSELQLQLCQFPLKVFNCNYKALTLDFEVRIWTPEWEFRAESWVTSKASNDVKRD